MTQPKKKRTMKRYRRPGFEGVYARYYGGKVTGYTSRVSDKTQKAGYRQLNTWPTAEEARKERLRTLAEGGHLAESTTIRQLFERYERDYLVKLKPGSQQTIPASLKPFVTKFGHVRLDRMNETELRQWADTAPLNNAKSARALLYKAKAWNLLGGRDNPLARLGRAESKGRENIEVISEEDLYGLADCAIPALGPDYGPVFRARMLFGAYTCLRPAEVCAQYEEDVRDDEVWVRRNYSGGVLVPSPKNGQWREVSLPPPAKRALASMPAHPDPTFPFLFWNQSGGPLLKSSEHGYWDTVRRAYAAKTGDPRWRDFDLYELRHYGASFCLNVLELPAELVAYMLGHTGQTGVDLVLRCYGHPDHKRWAARIQKAYAKYEDSQRQAAAEAAGAPRLRAVE
jgi:integrase